MKVEILKNKEASAHLDSISNEVIKIYTDGSMHDGKVEAAAILTRQGKPDHVLRLCLKTTEQHTVPEAKMVGIILGVHLIATEKCNCKCCIIGLDSQGAIKALRMKLTNPGQHLTAEALKIANYLQNRTSNTNYSLTVRWTAGHVSIPGNEKADREAK